MLAKLGQCPDHENGCCCRRRVSRKLVARAVNPTDNREVLVSLTRTGLTAHDTIVAGALERNQRPLDGISKEEVAGLPAQIERLTVRATDMLAAERDPAS